MADQEIADEILVFGLKEGGIGMDGAGNDVERAFNAGFLQGGVQFLTLLQGDNRVLVAVKDEEWRRLLGDEVNGARKAGQSLMGLNRAAEEQVHD